MTVTDKATQIVSFIRLMPDADAVEFVRAHLSLAYSEGANSGVQQVQQSLNKLFEAKTEAA